MNTGFAAAGSRRIAARSALSSSRASSKSLFTITRDPFRSWKHAERTWRAARDHGFEVVVVMDDRTSAADRERIEGLADAVFTFRSPGHCEPGYDLLPRCTGEFVLIVADDEEPSPALWDWQPPFPARFGLPVIPVVGAQMYRPDVGIQERYVYREGWKWLDGFEGHSIGAKQVYLERNPGLLIWHYDLDAPRREREAKAARYKAIDDRADHRSRLIYEEHPEGLAPLGELAKYLPR